MFGIKSDSVKASTSAPVYVALFRGSGMLRKLRRNLPRERCIRKFSVSGPVANQDPQVNGSYAHSQGKVLPALDNAASKVAQGVEISAEVRKNALDAAALKVAASIGQNRAKALLELKGKVEVKPLRKIEKEARSRYFQYFTRPTQLWLNKVEPRLNGSFDEQVNAVKEKFIVNETLVSPRSIFKPLDVGDAVELTSSLSQSVLGVIVEVPSREDDPRYTIMDRLGQLSFVEKSAVKLRLPGVIPKKWLKGIVYEVTDPLQGHGSIKTTLNHFKTFAVNPLARYVAVRPLIKITNDAWSQIQETSRKLEIIHRLLQQDGPREVSLFTLLKAIEYTDVDTMKNFLLKNQVDEAYNKIESFLRQQGSKDQEILDDFKPTKFGKEYGSIDPTEAFDAARLYSVVLSLKKQSSLWSTSYSSRSTLVPLSVTALPLDYSANVDSSINLINKTPSLVNEFHRYINGGDFSQIPDKFDHFFFILKEFAVGNITDARSSTLVSQLMKVHTSQDITRSIVYDFLIKTGYVATHLTNPAHFTTSLKLPYTGISNKATLEQEYFDIFDVETLNKNDLANERVDYTDLRVYCIDSETAHEIDDGVSIKKIDNDNSILYIHIADPTSYMTPDSTLAKIAFERGFTTYQPEVVSPMLPQSISELAGLGKDGRVTRALTFSVPFNKRTGMFDEEKFKVEATNISKFPKYTYDDVDVVLSHYKRDESSRLSASLRKNEDSALVDEEHRDLKEMFEVALKLRDYRISHEGAVVFGESLSPKVSVLNNIGDDSEVKLVKEETTDSVVLVSEFMILGNRIAGSILSRNSGETGGIFKGMSKLPLSGTADTVVERINKFSLAQKKFPTAPELVKAFKFIVPAHYSDEPKQHLMLGVSGYAPSTSPLRRFGDLVNHFQLHSILNKKPPFFSKDQVSSIALHLETRNDILKKASRSAVTFYSIRLIQEALERGEKLKSDLLISSRALHGQTSGILLDFGVHATINLLPNKRPPTIGTVLNNYEVTLLDCVGGNVELKELRQD